MIRLNIAWPFFICQNEKIFLQPDCYQECHLTARPPAQFPRFARPTQFIAGCNARNPITR